MTPATIPIYAIAAIGAALVFYASPKLANAVVTAVLLVAVLALLFVGLPMLEKVA